MAVREQNPDEKYLALVSAVLTFGTLTHNRTGIDTYNKNHQILEFNLDNQFPILTSKFVGFKTALKELFWIWQEQSNNVEILRNKYGVTIWDEWELPDHTIGKAYGYQLSKLYKYKNIDLDKVIELYRQNKIKSFVDNGNTVSMTQVDKLIYDLSFNQESRRMVVSLWNVEDLHEMSLEPCAFQTLWSVTEKRLDCMLIIRSNDLGLGCPYNMCQYAALVHMLAHVSNLQPGFLTIAINNAHVYVNHIDALKQQLSNEIHHSPRLIIDPNVKSFYEFNVDNIRLEGYKHSGKIEMEVAI